MISAVRIETKAVKAHAQSFSLTILVLPLLLMLLFISALSVIYIKSKSRYLFSELQTLHQTQEELHIAWGQLLLEQSAWATQSRIQQVAEEQMQMRVPTSKNIAMIQDQLATNP